MEKVNFLKINLKPKHMKHLYIKTTFVLFLLASMIGVTVVEAADITSTAQGGKWSDKTTWIGGVVPTATDNVIIASTVTANGGSYSSTSYLMINLTVNFGGKIIREVNSGGLSSLIISGNLINNGEIIDYRDYFDIHLHGNLINNGTLKPRYITLSGANQQLSGTAAIECKQINLNMSDEFAVAASNLIFKNCRVISSVSTNMKKLKMSKFSLSSFADSIRYDAYYGTMTSSAELLAPVLFDGTGILKMENSIMGGTIIGNVQVKSSGFVFFKDLTIEGNLTLEEGVKISSQGNLTKLRVKGDFTNYADLNKDTVKVRKVKFAPRSMYLYLYGNSDNLGSTGISTVYPTTNGKTISLTGNYDAAVYIQQAENYDKLGGKVLINSEVNISGKLDVYADLEIVQGGILNLLNKTLTSPIYVRSENASLTNNGTLNRYHRVNNGWSYRTYKAQPGTYADFELREWSDRIEGIDISVFNGQTYPNLPGSVKRWWRLKPNGNGKVSKYTLKLFYDEALLNGQKEENLKVFQSTDEGKNWKIISLGQYAKLDPVENSISIGDWSKAESMLGEFGDFVISSGDGSVPIPSPIVLKLVGRDKVRIGAPNRYTVQMYNVSDTEPSGSFLVSVNLDGDARFLQAEIPNKNGMEILPIDSIGNAEDNTLAFYVPYLNPKEESGFDVIIQGIPDATKSATILPVLIWVGGVAVIGATSVVADYVTDIIADKIEFSQQEKADLADATGIELKVINGHRVKEDITTYAMKTTLKATMEKLSALHPVTYTAFEVGNKLELAAKFAPSLRYRLIMWGKSWMNQDGKDELRLLEGKEISLEKVQSFDPNEKIGPTGYGEKNYMSSAGKMYYHIAFENKKEATAPAYRVQIVDTLSAVFDAETVKFGTSSHVGSQYNWKMERNGNILKWDIEGIELPPNATPPEGEGYVTFSVDLKDGLESGVPIENRATIVFDLNAPITTNTWSNVLDKIAPVTVMNPVNYSAGDTLVNVSCNAVDNENGAGVGRYEFFASVDNTPFKFLGETFENTIQYQVSDSTEHNYRFYVLTTDNVNNSEKSVPQIIELKSIPVSNKKLEDINNVFQLYPNPASGIITIEFFNESPTPVEVQLYSITGKLLKTIQKGSVEAGQKRIDFDISDLSKGVYFAKLILNKNSETFKVIKN
jgi:hypothetical protein